MNEKLLKKLIMEELKGLLKEEAVYPANLTPEQAKIRDQAVANFFSDPETQKIQGKYKIFLGASPRNIYQFFGIQQ